MNWARDLVVGFLVTSGAVAGGWLAVRGLAEADRDIQVCYIAGVGTRVVVMGYRRWWPDVALGSFASIEQAIELASRLRCRPFIRPVECLEMRR